MSPNEIIDTWNNMPDEEKTAYYNRAEVLAMVGQQTLGPTFLAHRAYNGPLAGKFIISIRPYATGSDNYVEFDPVKFDAAWQLLCGDGISLYYRIPEANPNDGLYIVVWTSEYSPKEMAAINR